MMTPARRGRALAGALLAAGAACTAAALTAGLGAVGALPGYLVVMVPVWAVASGAAGVAAVALSVALAVRVRLLGAPRVPARAWLALVAGAVAVGLAGAYVDTRVWADGVRPPGAVDGGVVLALTAAGVCGVVAGWRAVAAPGPEDGGDAA